VRDYCVDLLDLCGKMKGVVARSRARKKIRHFVGGYRGRGGNFCGVAVLLVVYESGSSTGCFDEPASLFEVFNREGHRNVTTRLSDSHPFYSSLLWLS
jgi:hypothetical protein